jgi:coenzyme F420 hydrogenase subunit beta
MQEAICNGSVLTTIVPNNVCVGCGMCAGMFPEAIEMYTNSYGVYLPQAADRSGEACGPKSLKVCPFADNGENEDTISGRLFGQQEEIKYRSGVGYFIKCFVGCVKDEQARIASTSGGLITYLASQLLSSGQVDAVACVGASENKESLFQYQLMTTEEQVRRCSKSRYYPVEISQVIKKIRETEARVLFVGLPCFVKAVRIASILDNTIKRRIKYAIGLFCGHLKSRHYCEYLARCCGVNGRDIKTVDFRKKVAGKPANDYAFEVVTRAGDRRQIMMRDVWGGNWTYNLFMLDACEYCDDVVAETADVSIGDAWLAEYIKDYRGTNVVVCRNREFLEMLEAARRTERLMLEEIDVEEVIKSQAGCFRQRRDGLSYRLYLSARKGQWRPRKRVLASRWACPFLFRLVQLLRSKTKSISREVFLKQQATEGLDIFVRGLRFWIWAHRVVNIMRRIESAVKRQVKKFATRFAAR